MDLDLYRRIIAGEAAHVPLGPRALWKLTGPDAERYLNGQVTNDVTRLTDGHALYAAVCTAKGRMEGDITIAKHGADFYLDADPALRESLGARLDKFLIADDAAFEDISESWNISHVFGVNVPQVPADGFVISSARFGLPGHDVWTPGNETPAAGFAAEADIIETLRLEFCIPRWGAELTTNTLPPEAGPHMLEAISYTKGCYVGQETIARLKSVGHVNKTLVCLQSESAEFPAVGAKLQREGREVGSVTSTGYSPFLERGLALGYVPFQPASEGGILKTESHVLTIVAPPRPRAKS